MLLSLVLHAGQIAAHVVSVPIFVRHLGIEMYGYWGALLGLCSYLSFLNLGIPQTVSSISSETAGGATRCAVGLGLRRFRIVLLVGIPALLITAWFAPWTSLFRLGSGTASVARYSAAVLLVSFLLELPFSMYRAALVGLGQVGFDRVVALVIVAGRTVAGVTCAIAGGSLWLVLLVMSAASLLGNVTYVLRLRRFNAPSHSSSMVSASAHHKFRFDRSAVLFLMLQATGALIWASDSVLAGTLLGPTEAAHINIGWRILSIVLTLGTVASPAIAPLLVLARVRGDYQRSQKLGLYAGQLLAGLVGLAVVNCLVGGEFLIVTWLGREMFMGQMAWSLLCAVVAVQAILIVPEAVVMQSAKHEIFAFSSLVEAALKIGASLAFVRWLGLAGLPLATLVARALTALWVLPTSYARLQQVDPARWIAEVMRPMLAGGAAFSIVYFPAQSLGFMQGILGPALVLVAASGAYLLGLLFLGIGSDLRSRIFSIRRPINKP